eukprot:TRINITY_DN14386_c0_g1_i1.p1 TRINITY_DN14386_c0_g1~~TRINITY_DN14386_c0_g1_i1.p1  ORF type:complete len:174 (-),score=46.74 TRINITY_DN14386_c0_g1_i1:137-658(-)
MIRRPPRSTLSSSSAASDVYKRQDLNGTTSMAGVATSTATRQPSFLQQQQQQRHDRSVSMFPDNNNSVALTTYQPHLAIPENPPSGDAVLSKFWNEYAGMAWREYMSTLSIYPPLTSSMSPLSGDRNTTQESNDISLWFAKAKLSTEEYVAVPVQTSDTTTCLLYTSPSPRDS